MPSRGFVDKDLQRMERVLKELNFEVFSPCLNRTDKVSREFLFDRCINDTTRDLAQYDCSLFYYSGHGNREGVVLSTPDERATYAEIIRTFNGSSTDKPKVFIFDCCRDDEEATSEDGTLGQSCCCGEISLHTLVVFACMAEERTYGRREKGSDFTTKLVNKLMAFADDLSVSEIFQQVAGNSSVILRLQKELRFKRRSPLRKREFSSKQEVMDHVDTIGCGVKVLVCYSPDPRSVRDWETDLGSSQGVKETRIRIKQLVRQLERHGFSVFTDLFNGSVEPTVLLKQYDNHLRGDDFVLVVGSQALKELFQMEEEELRGVSHQWVKLVYKYCELICGCIATETGRNSSTLIPLVIDPKRSSDVPTLFQGSIVYNITTDVEFDFDSDRGNDISALVCRMAGIDRVKIEQEGLRGPICHITGEGTVSMTDPEPTIESLLTLKPGYKFVSCQQQSEVQNVPQLHQLTRVQLSQEPRLSTSASNQTLPSVGFRQVSPALPPQSMLASTQALTGTDLVSGIPCSPVSKRVFIWLCDNVVEWKFVARHLGISEVDIVSVEGRDPNDPREQCYQMFLVWVNQYSPSGTYRDIGAAIAQSSKNRHLLHDYATQVQRLLNECDDINL